jgi:PAS domain S-box-containing protein
MSRTHNRLAAVTFLYKSGAVGQMDTIVKIGEIRPLNSEEMLRGERIDSTAIRSTSWEWMFRVLKVVAEHAAEGIVVLDAAGTIRFANEASAKAHGYASRACLLGRDLSAFHSPEQMADHVTPFIREALRQGHFEGPLEHLRRDGVVFSTDTKMARVRNEDWDDVGLIVFYTDTSQRQEAQAALAAAGEEFRKELARRDQQGASAPAQDRGPAAFCEKLRLPMSYRYSGDDEQGPDGENVVPLQRGIAEHDHEVGQADNPAETEADLDANDPYLELRKTSGGPLDTAKLAELAEILKRLS